MRKIFFLLLLIFIPRIVFAISLLDYFPPPQVSTSGGGVNAGSSVTMNPFAGSTPPTTYKDCGFEGGSSDFCGMIQDKNGDCAITNQVGEGVGGSRAVRFVTSTGSSCRLRISFAVKNAPLSNPRYFARIKLKLDQTTIDCCTSGGQIKLVLNRYLNCTGCIGWMMAGFGFEFPGSCSSVGNRKRLCFIRDQGTTFLWVDTADMIAGQYYELGFCFIRNSGVDGTAKGYRDTINIATDQNANEGDDTTTNNLHFAFGIAYRQNWSGTATIHADDILVTADNSACP